jgi:hypothetical protein
MGSFFYNISVLKDGITISQVKKYIVQFMKKAGFKLTENPSDSPLCIFIKDNPNSKWFTIYNDESDEEQMEKLACSISSNLKTYAMSVYNFDSDCMIIRLTREKEKDLVVVGHPEAIDDEEEFKNKHGNIEMWKPIAKDPDKLMKAFAEDYVFSEDVLTTMEDEIQISSEDVNMPSSIVIEEHYFNLCLYFSADEGGAAFFTDGDTILECSSYGKPEVGEMSLVSFINRGGKSTGISITIAAQSVDEDSIDIDEIRIVRTKNPREPFDWGTNTIEYTQKTQKGVSPNGRKIIYASFYDFEIPEGVNNDCKSLSGTKLQNTEFSHVINVYFTPVGKKDIDLTDLIITAQPHSNINGCGVTYPWNYWHSR